MAGFLTKQPAQSGFTLVEGLLTVLVISYGFMAVSRLQLNIWRNHVDSSRHYEAAQLAYSKLNDLRKTSSIVQLALPGGQDVHHSSLTEYYRSWIIDELPIAGRFCQVDVHWGSPKDKHSLSFTITTNHRNRSDDGFWVSRFE